MKRLFRAGLEEDFRTHSEHVLLQLGELMRSQDFQEGLTCFMEKRPRSSAAAKPTEWVAAGGVRLRADSQARALRSRFRADGQDAW